MLTTEAEAWRHCSLAMSLPMLFSDWLIECKIVVWERNRLLFCMSACKDASCGQLLLNAGHAQPSLTTMGRSLALNNLTCYLVSNAQTFAAGFKNTMASTTRGIIPSISIYILSATSSMITVGNITESVDWSIKLSGRIPQNYFIYCVCSAAPCHYLKSKHAAIKAAVIAAVRATTFHPKLLL